MSLTEQQLYIGGRYVTATSGETFETLNPATGETRCRARQAGPADIDRAVASARFYTRREPLGSWCTAQTCAGAAELDREG